MWRSSQLSIYHICSQLLNGLVRKDIYPFWRKEFKWDNSLHVLTIYFQIITFVVNCAMVLSEKKSIISLIHFVFRTIHTGAVQCTYNIPFHIGRWDNWVFRLPSPGCAAFAVVQISRVKMCNFSFAFSPSGSTITQVRYRSNFPPQQSMTNIIFMKKNERNYISSEKN